jgi:hypothetical protein
MTIKRITFGLLVTILLSCNRTTNNTSLDNNTTRVQNLGDTTQPKIEKQKDAILKYLINYKGLTSANYEKNDDNDFKYLEKLNDTTINSNFFITVKEYKFYFDNKKVETYCDSIIKGFPQDNSENIFKRQYENLKRFVQNRKRPKTLSPSFHSEEQELLMNFNSKIINSKTGEKPKSLLIEYYRTGPTGGKNIYIIRNNNDTAIELFSHVDQYIN